jgi:hypothetical protein
MAKNAERGLLQSVLLKPLFQSYVWSGLNNVGVAVPAVAQGPAKATAAAEAAAAALAAKIGA